MTDNTDHENGTTEPEAKSSYVHVTFDDPANPKIEIYGMSSYQMWGLGRMFEQIASDYWMQKQMMDAMQDQNRKKLSIARGIPADHLARQRN